MDITRLEAVIQDVDQANAADPRLEVAAGISRPKEVVYSERMTECLLQIYPLASEVLQIAARAQHICRWQIPRGDYPLGREGYNAWRIACRAQHAAIISSIMARHGFAAEETAHVADFVSKKRLKSDPESQALENVVGVVFVRHYLRDFIADHAHYDEAKLSDILRKTFRKMDRVGHDAVMLLDLPPATQAIIGRALDRELPST